MGWMTELLVHEPEFTARHRERHADLPCNYRKDKTRSEGRDVAPGKVDKKRA